MGENEAVAAGFVPTVVGDRKDDTGPEDTEQAARHMLNLGVDLLLFAGGDGTLGTYIMPSGPRCQPWEYRLGG